MAKNKRFLGVCLLLGSMGCRPGQAPGADGGPDGANNSPCEAALNGTFSGVCVEGDSCSSSNTDRCAIPVSCACRNGSYRCVSPDVLPPSDCQCPSDARVGMGCSNEGQECGRCCNSVDDPASGPVVCRGGSWQSNSQSCANVRCGSIDSCPLQPERFIGSSCAGYTDAVADRGCGNPCCGTAIECVDRTWVAGPQAECACLPQPTCGNGTCGPGEACVRTCGNETFSCRVLPAGCTDCACAARANEACEVVTEATGDVIRIEFGPACAL